MAEMAFGGWAGKGYTANLWIKYKLTREEFNKYWKLQEGRCAGCKGVLAHPLNASLETGLKPEVDHDHKTGKVRGLLCRRCNDFLGKVKDNQDLLKRLVEYLRRSGEEIL